MIVGRRFVNIVDMCCIKFCIMLCMVSRNSCIMCCIFLSDSSLSCLMIFVFGSGVPEVIEDGDVTIVFMSFTADVSCWSFSLVSLVFRWISV